MFCIVIERLNVLLKRCSNIMSADFVCLKAFTSRRSMYKDCNIELLGLNCYSARVLQPAASSFISPE